MRFKNLYFKAVKHDDNNKAVYYQGYHKNGFKFDIIIDRDPLVNKFYVYNLTSDRLILDDRLNKVNFKQAIKDINHFFNHRTIKWKNF